MLIKSAWGSLGSVSVALLMACGSSGKGSGPGDSSGGTGGTNGTSGGTGGQATGTAGTAGSGGGAPTAAGIQMRVAATAAQGSEGQRLMAFAGGGAVRPGLESLEYYIFSVQICESMDASGSGFSNPAGCLELYSGDRSKLSYGLGDDWTPLADEARALTTGFVDLLNPSARETLNSTTELTNGHVRSYNYGIITWSLPVKVKGSIPLGDGTFLYTHDGPTTFRTVGADNFRHYFTSAETPLTTAPSEKAVVLLGNGGNWFKFQNPLVITQDDIDEHRQWVLDLVFNPEGIVKGYAGDNVSIGQLEDTSGGAGNARAITVPLLDLAPIPHRLDEQVVRESYLASMNVSGQSFDVRLELYSVDGDPARTVYGVDAKTLVTAASTNVPTEFSKVSYVVPESDGTLTFQSFNQSELLSGFTRVTEEFGTTHALVHCAEHSDREGAQGGAAIVVESCPSAEIDVTFRLVGRTLLDGELPTPPVVADAGADSGAPVPGPVDAGAEPDATADAAL